MASGKKQRGFYFRELIIFFLSGAQDEKTAKGKVEGAGKGDDKREDPGKRTVKDLLTSDPSIMYFYCKICRNTYPVFPEHICPGPPKENK